jgi:hypothetical protein
VKTVEITTDVGNIDEMIGSAGEVRYEANTLRATASQELLAQAIAVPFDLEAVPSADPSVFVARVSPMPEGFKRLPPPSGASENEGLPGLLRQFNARIMVPVDVAVVVESSRGNVRIDTRQAPTTVSVEAGTLVLLNVAAALTVRNGEGDTMIADHRGPLDVKTNHRASPEAKTTGKTRITFAAVTGAVRVVNDIGETAVYVPEHASIDLEARSESGAVRNAFGFASEPAGARGQVVRGKLGDGAHPMRVVAGSGTLTVATRSAAQ